MWIIGNVVYMCTVIIVNNKLLLDANSLSFLPIMIYILSNALLILVFYLLNLMPSNTLYQLFNSSFQNVGSLFLLFMFTFSIWPF